MKVKLIAYGIAKDILKRKILEVQCAGHSINDLKLFLLNQYPEFGKLSTLSFAVEEEYRQDDYLLREDDEVVIIPPVSGG